MKLLHLPLNVPGSEQVGQANGFREVFDEVVEFDYLPYTGQNGNDATNRELLRLVDTVKPDIIWAQLQETNILTPHTWGQVKQFHPEAWLTTWSGDSRDYVPPYLASVLPLFDIFYNATDQKMYLDYAKRMELMPIAIDPGEGSNFSHVTPPVPKIVFIGNHYGDTFPNSQGRLELMIALSKEFGNDFGVYGSGWPHGEINLLGATELKHQSTYYHKAKVVISIDHFKDFCFWSERRIWALMSATPTLVQWHPGIEKYFKDHKCSIFFMGPEDCIEHARWLLDNPNDAEFIGERGRKVALENHTWKQRGEQIRKDYDEREKS